MRTKISITSHGIVSFVCLVCWRVLFTAMVMAARNTKIPVDVGVVIDMESRVGKIGLSCIKMSLTDFYADHPHYKTRLLLHIRDSNKDVVGAATAAVDLIKNVEVKAIIGPSTSMQANFVVDLGKKAKVPIISFSASSSSIKSPYFFQARISDTDQVNAISAIVQVFGWKEVVPLYVDDEYGIRVIPHLTNALQQVDARVPYRSAISLLATDDQILEELYKLKTMQTRVFVLHMPHALGSRLFVLAKSVGMINKGYVWIMTDGMTNYLDSMDYIIIESMQGVLGVKPHVSRTEMIENFRTKWKKKFHHYHPDIIDAELNIYGLWAYDATTALAMAIEKVATTTPNFGFRKVNVSTDTSTNLGNFGESRIGPKLFQALSTTNFKGITGNFRFINGQLQSSTFQVVNVHSDGTRTVGFWLPEKGLAKRIMPSTAQVQDHPYLTNLSTIIWPGDTYSVPKGWEIPENGKKLRIGVPVKEGFTQFVSVTRNLFTNTSKVEGYCIDLFDAVVSELPYAVTYDYIPFANSDGKSAGSYNSLIDQVYLGKYDAAVGDIFIVANRSSYVDYTLPYMQSGKIMMVVPITDDDSKKAWVFLKPLTWDLWITSLCFFFFIGFVVWVLEHRINDDFRGPLAHQVGTSFWFSFSTMLFVNREKVVSNLARMMVIIWCFVGLILTQSYTASLSSFLTIQQLQPSVTTVDELIKNGEKVGYQKGSFIPSTLKSLGFDETKIVPYESAQECNQLLSKGSQNGGIAAAFEEPFFIRLILAQNCSKYTLIEATSKLESSRWKNKSNIKEFSIAGLGFAFPKASPLAPDISRAILKVTGGDKIKEIEGKWFGTLATCPDRSNSPPNRLGLSSFWGLFLIAGIISLLALVTYVAMFIYQHRQVLTASDSEVSTWRRKAFHLLKLFNQKDFKSHTFKKHEMNDGNGITLATMSEPSPLSTYSVETDFTVGQGRPSSTSSIEDVDPNLTNNRLSSSYETMFIVANQGRH